MPMRSLYCASPLAGIGSALGSIFTTGGAITATLSGACTTGAGSGSRGVSDGCVETFGLLTTIDGASTRGGPSWPTGSSGCGVVAMAGIGVGAGGGSSAIFASATTTSSAGMVGFSIGVGARTFAPERS